MTSVSSKTLVWIAVVLVIALAGCGSGESTHSVTNTKEASTTPHFLPMAKGHRKPGESACTGARVIAAKTEKAIDIIVHCVGEQKQSAVSFSVRRKTSNRPRPFPELLRYQQVPKVTSDGSTRRAGLCQVADRELGCEAHVHGKSTVAERIWVKRDDRCTQVAITRISAPPCVEGTCSGGITVHQLFLGRPRGC